MAMKAKVCGIQICLVLEPENMGPILRISDCLRRLGHEENNANITQMLEMILSETDLLDKAADYMEMITREQERKQEHAG